MSLHSHTARPLRRRRPPPEPSLGERLAGIDARLATLVERLANILTTLAALLALGQSRAAPWRHE